MQRLERGGRLQRGGVFGQGAGDPTPDPDAIALSALVTLENNRVQRVGPLSGPAASIFFDSAPFTLQPTIFGPKIVSGSPTVVVTGSATVTGTAGQDVLFQLVRDRGTVNQVILAQQHAEIGAAATDIATATLVFLDTVDTVDAISGTPSPLVEISTHTWSIVATAAGALTGDGRALVLVEQEPGGHSVTLPFPPAAGVFLGTASQYASFGSAGITNTGTSSITGDLGTPSTASSITGFGLVLDGSGQFSTSAQVIGKVYAVDYAVPTPAKVTQANVDMMAAYTDASTRAPTHPNDFNGGILGGQTLTPGVWKWTTVVTIDDNLTLNGAGVYIFQIAGTMELAAAKSILLTNGALPQNVFWAIAGAVTLHAGSSFQGELLGATSIAMQSGATARGRLLSQTGVTLISDTVIEQ
jgi:hypothetical protein